MNKEEEGKREEDGSGSVDTKILSIYFLSFFCFISISWKKNHFEKIGKRKEKKEKKREKRKKKKKKKNAIFGKKKGKFTGFLLFFVRRRGATVPGICRHHFVHFPLIFFRFFPPFNDSSTGHLALIQNTKKSRIRSHLMA